MVPSTTSTFTIQPWTVESDNAHDLRDVLSRAQRGHLRDITESSLQEEIAAEGGLDLSDSSSVADSEADEDADLKAETKKTPFGKPSTREDLFNARRYMLEAIGAARQEVSIALDLMSLVVSKENPKAAQVTMGKHVRENIPPGTIGVDMWQRMPVDQAREAQNALLATNVKMEGLQSSADSLLGSAKRMEENVRRETEYWDQVLSISERGWNVCLVPGQQHRLGVRFGFSESAPQFSRKGIAALNPDREGGIRLERGIGTKPRALRGVLRKGGKIVGVSRVPAVQDADETTLEARIRHARDSLFDEELYYEMIRESRTLGSLGVTLEGSTIRLRNASSEAEEGVVVEMGLISLDEENGLPDASSEYDTLAQGTILAARLLLGQAHRDRLRKRSEPPPPLSEKQRDEKPILPILRPLMSLMLHRSSVDELTQYLAATSGTLHAAKIDHTLQPPTLSRLTRDTEDQPTTAERLLTTTLLRPLRSLATMTLFPSLTGDSSPPRAPRSSQTFTLTLETSLAHAFGTVYTLRLPPISHADPPTDEHQPAENEHKFYDLPALTAALSTSLAMSLSHALLPLVQNAADEWRVRDHEAVIEKDVGIGELEEDVTLDFDKEGAGLRMVYSAREGREFVWKADEDRPGNEGQASEGLFEAVRGCAT